MSPSPSHTLPAPSALATPPSGPALAVDRGAGVAVSLRALRAVAAVAAAGSAAQAASLLHLSPSAVTRSVQDAEAALGTALFDRGARGMVATAACRALVVRVERAFAMLQEAAQGLRVRGAPEAAEAFPRLVNETLLRALVARASHPTEAAAARALGLSQPALNQTLQRLEHAAKMRLFERTLGGMRLNEAGEWVMGQARRALAEIRIGQQELARWRGEATQALAIGALPMASDVLVPKVLSMSLAREPDLHLDVLDGTYESLTRALRFADVDLVVGPLRGAQCAPDLVEETLYVDRFVAVVRRDHPAVGDGRHATLQSLAACPWIGPLAGTPAAAAFDQAFARAGLPRPHVSLRAHSVAVVRSMLLASDHVALVSPLHVHAEVQAGLLVHATGPLSGTERAIGLTQRRDALPSSACRRVLAAFRTATAEALAGT